MNAMEGYKEYVKEVEESYDENAEEYTEAEETPDVILFDQQVISLLPSLNGKMILDAGCGPGIFCELLAREGAEVVGIDISSKLLNIARKRCERYKNCTFYKMDVEGVAFDKNSFDIVLNAFEVMYHKDLKKALKGFHRILKAEGTLLLLIPHPVRNMGMHRPLDYFKTGLFKEKWGIGMVSKKFYLTFQSYINSLIDCGFTVKKIWEPPPPKGKLQLYDMEIKFPPGTVYPQAMVIVSEKFGKIV